MEPTAKAIPFDRVSQLRLKSYLNAYSRGGAPQIQRFGTIFCRQRGLEEGRSRVFAVCIDIVIHDRRRQEVPSGQVNWIKTTGPNSSQYYNTCNVTMFIQQISSSLARDKTSKSIAVADLSCVPCNVSRGPSCPMVSSIGLQCYRILYWLGLGDVCTMQRARMWYPAIRSLSCSWAADELRKSDIYPEIIGRLPLIAIAQVQYLYL